jgi:hypothetical protein
MCFCEKRQIKQGWFQANQSNSFGRVDVMRMEGMSPDNCYGLVVSYCPIHGDELPVICGHGGSLWLCKECAINMINTNK